MNNNNKTLNIEHLDNNDVGTVMGGFGITAGSLIIFESIILANMIAPGDKNPPISWSKVDFFDTDYEKDLSTLIPLDPNDTAVYTINNPVGGNCIEGASAKVMALSSMLFFVGYLLEKNSVDKLHDLYDSLKGLAYSTNFLNEQEQKHYFELTD